MNATGTFFQLNDVEHRRAGHAWILRFLNLHLEVIGSDLLYFLDTLI